MSWRYLRDASLHHIAGILDQGNGSGGFVINIGDAMMRWITDH